MTSGLTPTERLVGLTLSLHMDRDGGSCWPSLTTLANETGLSRRTVIRALNTLDAEGYIKRARGGPGRPTRYEGSLLSDADVTRTHDRVVTPTTLLGVTGGTQGRPLGRSNGGGTLRAAPPPKFDPDLLNAQVAEIHEVTA